MSGQESIFNLFKIGLGPSSSHTMGPMTAAYRFLEESVGQDRLEEVARIRVELYGSLALTGAGHGTPTAVILGLAGESADTVDPDGIADQIADVKARGRLCLQGVHEAAFDPHEDIRFLPEKRFPYHPNALSVSAWNEAGEAVASCLYYSIGGGFVLSADEAGLNAPHSDAGEVPYPYSSAEDLLQLCERHGLTIAELAWANETARWGESGVAEAIDRLWRAMEACIERGCRESGILPGGLNVKRRAPKLAQDLWAQQREAEDNPLSPMDFINLWALAVNEENAAGGRVVTAPTNGAAGIIPAVLKFCQSYVAASETFSRDLRTFLLTAGAIGLLYKQNASISGAEMGCQGEVGVACSMAAAGLTAVMGGSNAQIENAAEIGMEHNLGLTCDPVRGLVQVPCIERNAVGAVKAVEAARLAMRGDGSHVVPLDKVIETMRQTGLDMQDKYKETSQGGLAVNVTEC